MYEHAYIVTWTAADGQKKTESITGRNHLSIVRSIKRDGGTVFHIELDEIRAPKSRKVKNFILAVILFIVVAVSVVALKYYRM